MKSLKAYSYTELRAIIPEQKQHKTQPSRIRWHDFELAFSLPIEYSVPLYTCLTQADRDLIDYGVGEGSRNDRGFALAANLVATANFLSSLGQSYDKTPRQLFEQYCHNCTPAIGSSEVEAIWKSVNQRTTNPSLSPEEIENCIKGWKWRQLQGDKQPSSQGNQQQYSPSKGNDSKGNDGSGNNVVYHPTASRQPLNTEQLKAQVNLLIAQELSQSELVATIPEIARKSGRSSNDVWKLHGALLQEQEQTEERSESIKGKLSNLLKAQQQQLSLGEFLYGDGGRLAQMMNAIAEAMPTAPEFLFTTLIPAAGSRIGTASRVIIKASARYTQPAIFRTCIVARSGAKKTPAQKIIIDPLNQLESEEYYIWQKLEEAYQSDLKSYKAKKGDQKGEPPKEPPPRVRFIMNDTTIEAKVRIHSQNPRGILLYQDEWAAGIAGRNKYRGGIGDDAELELSEFNGGSLSKDRVSGSIYLEKSAISRTGSTQWETLRRVFGDHSDFKGEFARTLFCAAPCPPAKIVLTGKDGDPGIYEYLRYIYEQLAQLPEQDYFLNQEAKLTFQNWQNNLVELELSEANPGLAVAYAKFESYTSRLALWLHVVNSVLAGNMKPSPIIDGATMLLAADLTAYYIGQLKLIYAQNAQQERLDGILLSIQTLALKKGTITAKDCKNSIWQLKNDKSATLENIRGHFQGLAANRYGKTEGSGKSLRYLVDRSTWKVDELSTAETSTSSQLEQKVEEVDGFLSSSQESYPPKQVEKSKNLSKATSTYTSQNGAIPSTEKLSAVDVTSTEVFTKKAENLVVSVAEGKVDVLPITFNSSTAQDQGSHFQPGDRVKIHCPGSKNDGKYATVQRLKEWRGLQLADLRVDGERNSWEAQVKCLSPVLEEPISYPEVWQQSFNLNTGSDLCER